jgi:hypothetical protein
MAPHTTVHLGDKVDVFGRTGILKHIMVAANGMKVLQLDPVPVQVEEGEAPAQTERQIKELSVFVTDEVTIRDRAK